MLIATAVFSSKSYHTGTVYCVQRFPENSSGLLNILKHILKHTIFFKSVMDKQCYDEQWWVKYYKLCCLG